MATSKPHSGSIRKEQTALVCQLCENEPKIKWKCLQCSLMMCQRCRDKVHPKFKSAESHQILDLKDVGKLKFEEEVDFSQFKCDQHSGQPCCLFCEGCKIMICPRCVAGIHKKHDLVEIKVEIQRKVVSVQNRIKVNESQLKELKENERKLREFYSTEKDNYDKSCEIILEQEKHILNILQNHTRTLKDHLNEKWIDIDHSVSEEIKQVIESGTKLEAQNKTLLEILHSNDPVKIFGCSASYSKIKPIVLNFNTMPVFVPNKLHENDLKYGSLKQLLSIQKQPSSISTSNTKFQLLNQFTLDHDITKIKVGTDNSIWVAHRHESILINMKVNETGPKISNLFTDLYVYDMDFSFKQDLLLSSENYEVSVIPCGSNEINILYDSSPLVTEAIHVTKDRKIIIGAMNDGPHFPVGKKSKRKVIILNEKGKVIRTLDIEKDRMPQISFPSRIARNSKGYIAVIDIHSQEYDGRVVVLNANGKIKSFYNGHPDINTDSSFKPSDIELTPQENFLVLDCQSCCFHVLDERGDFKEFYDIRHINPDGIPQTFSFDNNNQHLYIGYTSIQYEDSKAKPIVCVVQTMF